MNLGATGLRGLRADEDMTIGKSNTNSNENPPFDSSALLHRFIVITAINLPVLEAMR